MTVSEKHMATAQNIMDEACLPVKFYENGVVRAMQEAMSAALAAAEREGREDERKRCAEIVRNWQANIITGERIDWYAERIAKSIISQAGEA